jgi:hypothetical protein
MRIGVVFPTLEVADPSAVRDYAQAAEDLGYTHLTAWEQWSASTSPYAALAATLLSQATAAQVKGRLADQLQVAFEHRNRIERAKGDPSTARVVWDVLTRPDSSTAGVAREGQHGFYGAERCTIRLPGRAADRFRVRPSRVATRPRTS